MQIRAFPNGPFMINTYLTTGEGTVVIDPGHDCSELIGVLRRENRVPDAIIITHAHIDHVAGVPSMLTAFPDTPVLMGRQDVDLLNSVKFQASMFSLPDPGKVTINRFFEDNDVLQFRDLSFLCIHTPGHSEGSYSLVTDNAVFTGDLIFLESVGRTDLFGGNFSVLSHSIRDKIFTLLPDFVIYPGHGPETTVRHEMEHNRFLR